MLSIGKLVVGQQRYYEQQVAQGGDDYYSGRGEAPGHWIGAGARALGLHGHVSGVAFNALIAGRDPRDETKRLRDGREPKVAGLDLTFSAPKSVSVLFAVADENVGRELIAAHEAAVAGAVEWLEAAVVQVRRSAGGHVREPGEGLIAAAYRHRMSRALDPQLHTHVVAANMTRGPDGRYTALFGAPLYRAAKTAGYLYQAHLRTEVTERLGLVWGPVRKGAAELRGVPEGVLDEFSRRRHEMERAAAAGGFSLLTKRSAEAAAVDTRDRKRYGIETHTWREEILARAAEHGLDQDSVTALLARARDRGTRQREPIDTKSVASRMVGPEGLTARANTFDRRIVLQEFAQAAGQGARVRDVREWTDAFANREDVLGTSTNEMTTVDLVQSEARLIDAAVGRLDDAVGRVSMGAIDRLIERSGDSLSAEQQEVIRAVATTGHGVDVIEALAGTGKTYVAGVLRSLYEQEGFCVVGTAPTGRAVRELIEEAGIETSTIDKLLFDIEQRGQEIQRGSIVVLDEAGMAPTRLSARLLEHAEGAGAKVIALGDSGQLPSVLAGGWLRAVGERTGVLRLTEVVRQRDVRESRALAALHDGAPAVFIGWAEEHRRIEVVHGGELYRRAIEEWAPAADEHGVDQAVMIARDNETRSTLNDLAREDRRGCGQLGFEEAFDAVIVAEGDRVICRRNDARVDVDNGTRGTVIAVAADGITLRTDSGLLRDLPRAYVAEHVEHAYCLTGHGMQGGTVERAIVVATPHDLTRGWSYTALSRARGITRLLIADCLEAEQNDREAFAPAGRAARVSRDDVLARVARHMSERDDEDLAITQLRPAGHEDDPALRSGRSAGDEVTPERAAADADRVAPGPDRSQLVHLRAELTRLELTLSTLPLRSFARLDRVDQHILEVSRRLAERREQLEPPGEKPGRRGFRRRSGSDERVFLKSAIELDESTLRDLQHQREALYRDVGDPEQIRSERHALESTIASTNAEYEELVDRIVEDELAREPGWARAAFGDQPSAPRHRDAWLRGVREVARYRLEHEISDTSTPLGREPREEGRTAWQRANEALVRAQRLLGVEPADRAPGIDLGRD